MKLGFLVHDLGPSQLAFHLVRSCNRLAASGEGAPVIFFQEPSRPCVDAEFAVMQQADAWLFDGVAVATSLPTASKLVRLPRAAKRFFYLWDLDWLRLPGFRFEELNPVYTDPKLILVARTPQIARVVESCWGKPVPFTSEAANATEFLEFARG